MISNKNSNHPLVLMPDAYELMSQTECYSNKSKVSRDKFTYHFFYVYCF